MSRSLSIDDLTGTGAHRRGHFRLSSGLHSADYLQCALYLTDPKRSGRAGELLAESLRSDGIVADLVVAPAMGGIIIGHEVARALGVPSLFAERHDGRMCLRRGFTVKQGARVVVAEDVVTTGRSTREVLEVLAARGAEIVGVTAIVNRSDHDDPFGPLPFHCLLDAHFEIWEPSVCPLCAAGEPLERPGSRDEE